MTIRATIMTALLFASALTSANGLLPLDDSAMADVTGREGIGLNMEFLINTDIAGDGSICLLYTSPSPRD